MIIAGSIIVFLLALIYILLMGPTKLHEGGVVAAMHHFITVSIWVYMSAVMERVLGERICSWISRFNEYLFMSAHPLLQVFYLSLLTGCVSIFVVQGWPLLPGLYLSDIHSYIVPVSIFLTYYTYYLACYTDPGTVTKQNYKALQKLFPYDGQIFPHRKECSTCKIPRPARSKHCSLCKKCVIKCDHHCAWLNNCVGYYNYRWFMSFLFVTGSLCLYNTYLCWYLFKSELDRQKLLELFYKNDQDEMVPVTMYIAVLIFMKDNTLLVALAVFSSMACFIVYAFMLYHVNLIARGTTTNESFKHEDYAEEWQNKGKSPKFAPKNAFNLGVFGNFSQVFFPSRALNDSVNMIVSEANGSDRKQKQK